MEKTGWGIQELYSLQYFYKTRIKFIFIKVKNWYHYYMFSINGKIPDVRAEEKMSVI